MASWGTTRHISYIVCGKEDSTNFIADRICTFTGFLPLILSTGAARIQSPLLSVRALHRTSNICSIQVSNSGEDVRDMRSIEVERFMG